GESLVAYKLKELRTMLNVVDDPENLVRLEGWSKQDLARLIGYAGVGRNARSEYALALRQEGVEFWQNGNLSPALEKFQQSWALLAAGYRDDRSNHLLFYELGQAEYWIGQTYLDQGDLDAAETAFTSYAEVTRRLILLQPENAEWVLEMAYALTGLGGLQKSRDADNPDRTLQFMQSSLEYNQIALVLDPANEHYQSELGQSHAFLADAQLDVCDLEGALKSRQENLALDRALLETDPDDIDRIQTMAFALTGYAKLKHLHGEIDEAMTSLETAVELLEEILARDVENRDTLIDILDRQQYLAHLMILKGKTDAAWELLNGISDKWQDLNGISGEDMRTSLVYIEFLIDRARLARIRGDSQLANQLLNDIQLHLAASQSNMSFRREAGNMLVDAVFLQWEVNGELPSANILSQLPEYIPGRGRARACDDASKAALKAIMLGQQEQANEFTGFLLEKGYRETDFMGVCRRHSVCSGQ
ncbi:MAG: hypothetical protein GY732_12130, partial [Gammaproteobacteria bacterium]|nr:hypothetical protein [Gammaproteobacteria bacterium]